MMSFCKKSVHSLLGLITTMNMEDNPSNSNINVENYEQKHEASCLCGLGLITATEASGVGESFDKAPNVLESLSVRPPPPPMPKKDPGRIGFIDDIGGGVHGLMSCTESLGFESSDERRVDDDIDLCSRGRSIKLRNKIGEKKQVKKLPPPLSSFNPNGQPTFFLKPIRTKGRLELTEVRINRPEILRASRQDGRLRLHFIAEEQEQELEDQEPEEEQGEEEEEEEEEEEIDEEIEEWRYPVTGGDGLRRCNEMVTHHHDHHNKLHVWSQHCVITR